MDGSVSRFGAFEVDEGRRELRRDGAPMAVQPLVFNLLCYLVRHRDRAVPREELLQRLWPGIAVADNSLNTAIYGVRAALGDDGGTQSFVRTERGHGFRFTAPVELVPAPYRSAAPPIPEGVPFVGRADALERLARAWESSSGGAGRVLLIEGSAGAGKTTIVRRFADALPPGAAHAGRCYEGCGAPPFWPWTQVLRTLLASADAAAGGNQAVPPPLVPLLGTPREQAGDETAAGPEGRFRLFDAVTALVRRVARVAPTFVFLDDLHWADEPSLRLFEFVAAEIADLPVLLVGTYRDEEIADGAPLSHTAAEVAHALHGHLHVLAGLADHEVAELLRALCGSDLDPGLVDSVCRRTEGNPLFVKEFARFIAANGHVQQSAPAEPPRAIHDLLARRVGRLSPDAQRAMAVAAVTGREFNSTRLRRIWPGPEPFAYEWLDEALRARLVVGVAEDPDRYRFTHALFPEVLYARLPLRERAALHGRVASALEAAVAGGASRLVTAFAHHACESLADGGTPERAIAACRRAADHAMSLLAYEEAARLCERALAVLDWLPAPAADERARILVALGEARARSGDEIGAQHSFRSAADIARAGGMAALFAEAALGHAGPAVDLERAVKRSAHAPPCGRDRLTKIALLEEALAMLNGDAPLRVRVLACLARELLEPATRPRCLDLSAEALAIAEALGDPRTLADVVSARREVLCAPEDTEARIALDERIVELGERVGDRGVTLRGRLWRLIDRLELGDMALVRADLAVCRHLSRELGQPHYLHIVAVLDASLALLEGRLTELESLAERAYELGRRLRKEMAEGLHFIQIVALRREQGRLQETIEGLRAYHLAHPESTVAHVGFAYCLAELGQLDLSAQLYDEILCNGVGAIPRDRGWLMVVAILSNICARLDDVRHAGALYEALLPFAQRNVVGAEGLTSWGSASFELGLLAWVLDRGDAAEHHFETAVAVNERLGAVAYSAQIGLAFGAMLIGRRRRGDLARAREMLQRSRDLAGRFSQRAVERDASWLLGLADSGVPVRPGRSPTDRVRGRA